MEIKSTDTGKLYTKDVRIGGYISDGVESMDVLVSDENEFMEWLFKNPYMTCDDYDSDVVEVNREEYERVLNLANMFIELGKEKGIIEEEQ